MRRVLILLFGLLWPVFALADTTVAVLYFDNTGNEELEPLKVGLTDMMISDLIGTPGVTIVERVRLQEILDELELGHSGVADASTAARVGKVLGAQWVVFGSYMEFRKTFQVAARVVEVETTATPAAAKVHGNARDFIELESELVAKLRPQIAELAARTDAPEAGEAAPAPKPKPKPKPDAAPSGSDRGESGGTTGSAPAPTPAPAPASSAPEVVTADADTLGAAVAFSEGLIYLDKKDVERARESFETAVAKDPDLDAAQAQLAALEL